MFFLTGLPNSTFLGTLALNSSDEISYHTILFLQKCIIQRPELRHFITSVFSVFIFFYFLQEFAMLISKSQDQNKYFLVKYLLTLLDLWVVMMSSHLNTSKPTPGESHEILLALNKIEAIAFNLLSDGSPEIRETAYHVLHSIYLLSTLVS